MVAGAASASAQSVCRVSARGKPRGSRAKNNSSQERQEKCKSQYGKRRHRTNWEEVRAMEGEREQQSRRRNGDDESGDTPAYGEEDAFSKSLIDDLPSRGAHGQPHGGLSSTCDTSRQ